MRVIFDDLGYPSYDDATLQELFALVEIDGTIIPAANVKSTYETIIDLAKQNVGDAFDIFPSTDVVVIGGPFGGYYIGRPADGSRPGAFYAGTTERRTLVPDAVARVSRGHSRPSHADRDRAGPGPATDEEGRTLNRFH